MSNMMNMAKVARVNKVKGWFDESRSVGEEIALLHSEVSEMLEQYREIGLKPRTVDGKPDDFASEVADVYIRLLDTCYRHGINLDVEFERKIAYNWTRDYKHGGKKL